MSETENPTQEIAGNSFDLWLSEIKQIGCSDPLSHFRDNSYGQINLERAHPGGLAQFVTGRPALLSNLVRDPLSFSRALSAARRIKAKQAALSDHFGLETLYMASGLVDLSADGKDLRMPVLLWPVNLVRKHDDFELSLSRKAIVNPALAPALYSAYGVRLNNEELLSHVQVGSDPIPIRVLDHIAALTDSVGAPELRRILVISNFSSAAIELASDFRRSDSPVLALLSGEVIPEASHDLGVADPIAVTDSDATQTKIVSRALAGASFAVETLPGCGYTQTVVLLIAALAHQGKRVLVLAPRRQTLNELADRMAQIGLQGLGIRSNATWMDMIGAISRNEKATAANYSSLATLRDSAREQVSNYFASFGKVDGELGVSIEQALEQLSKLAASQKPPLNEARIDADQLGRHRDLTFAMTLLRQASELGEFEIGPEDSAWFRASFENQQEIPARVALARALHQGSFQALSDQLAQFTLAVEFVPAQSVTDWVSYLELFVGIRDTLDRFKPEVFDRPLTELILATAPRKDKSVMSGANRRRLKKLAKEYLRPGMHVADMHMALKDIQSQRDAWARHCLVAKPPQVPLGIASAQTAVNTFVEELKVLQQHLDSETINPALVDQPLEKLQAILRSLAEDTVILDNYPERAMTQSRLDEAGLGQLSVELAKLHTAKDALQAELELAWWKSALETLLQRSGSSLAGDHGQVLANEQRFAQAESDLIREGSKTVAFELATAWKQSLERFPSEAQTLKELLKLKRAVLSEVQALAPNIYQVLAPVVMCSPYEVPSVLAKGDNFDVALVLDGAGSSIAENYAGLARASQAIIFGDDAIAAATGFSLECIADDNSERVLTESIFTAARSLMPVEVLRRSYRSSGQALGDYVNSEFYGDRIIFEPSVDSYFGRSNVQLVKINTAKASEPESMDTEVAQVLELIYNHATWNPQDSLLVATASSKHADRLDKALAAGIREKAHLAEFFEGHGREKFEITTIQDLAHRIADRVIFSIGFGKDSSGNVPKHLGFISHRDGHRYLANCLVSARKHITVVSALEPTDLVDPSIIGCDGLREMLSEIAKPSQKSQEADVNPMIADLAIRLTKLGVTTRTNFSSRFKLVASVGEKAAVIEPDWGLLGYNLSERHRLRPMMIRALGWDYIRVPSFELFADPEAVAQHIAIALGIELSKKPQPLFEMEPRAFEDTHFAWGDPADSNDQRLREDKPPHWG
jgi:hypothetical protein